MGRPRTMARGLVDIEWELADLIWVAANGVRGDGVKLEDRLADFLRDFLLPAFVADRERELTCDLMGLVDREWELADLIAVFLADLLPGFLTVREGDW